MKHAISRKSLSDQVYDHIKKMILSGELKAGERIPEASLSELFGVSRTPLRDAMKKLADYGLIYLKPRSYAEVVSINKEEARQIKVVRMDLEILSARLFSSNATKEQFEELKAISTQCLKLYKEGDEVESFELDSLFHMKIAENCGNSCLFEMFSKLDARIQLIRLNDKWETLSLTDYIKQHNLLISAMELGDENKIRSILEDHILHKFIS